MVEFWIKKKGLYHEDPKSNNVFVTPNLDRLTLIDYGRSRRVTGLTQKMISDITHQSLRGFTSLLDQCNEKPSKGRVRNFPPLIKPSGVSVISDKEKAAAAAEQDKRLEAQIQGQPAGGGETSEQGAERNA
ncbi:uncharacterized protein BT62DRAFT_781766 [Guyanagaster necrorhizus]|uniref:Protein kinase domain-containing protein n=1 Tax=Guyanagaster necrorhizus TaxID=856835 RepID=A0A9P7VVQ3_9AGAR|nr:uncharacterized protein BT62DRAFT_781766 [Guyanagaster necrorhizus MCA 3950]KAG7447565.1 hypothetical protein BT62DRAFT_781766 [Guyanagaster necrorhizus MCA 3950]